MTDLLPLPIAFFDEFGRGADDRAQDYARACVDHDRAGRGGVVLVPEPALTRMDECRAGCDAGDPFYADVRAWDAIRPLLASAPAAQPAGASDDVLAALVAQWRNDASGCPDSSPRAYNNCADDLQAALAAVRP